MSDAVPPASFADFLSWVPPRNPIEDLERFHEAIQTELGPVRSACSQLGTSQAWYRSLAGKWWEKAESLHDRNDNEFPRPPLMLKVGSEQEFYDAIRDLRDWCRGQLDRLRAMISPPPQVAPQAVSERMTGDREALERAALAALLTVGPNASEIARQVGVPRGTLLGWPIFRAHYDRVKADAEANRNNRRGSRSGSSDFADND